MSWPSRRQRRRAHRTPPSLLARNGYAGATVYRVLSAGDAGERWETIEFVRADRAWTAYVQWGDSEKVDVRPGW